MFRCTSEDNNVAELLSHPFNFNHKNGFTLAKIFLLMDNNVGFRCCHSSHVEAEKVIWLKSFTRFLIKLKFDCTMKLFERFNRRRLLTQSRTQNKEVLGNWKGFFKSINHELEGFQPWCCYRIPVDCLEPSIIQHSRFQIVCFYRSNAWAFEVFAALLFPRLFVYLTP